LARCLHYQKNFDESLKEYGSVSSALNENLILNLGLGSIYIERKEFPAAINTFENVLRKFPRNIEALISLASIQTYQAFNNSSNTESIKSKGAAKKYFEEIFNLFEEVKNIPNEILEFKESQHNSYFGKKLTIMEIRNAKRVKERSRDELIWAEAGRIWSEEEIERSIKYYREAIKIRLEKIEEMKGEEEGEIKGGGLHVPSEWYNNLATLIFKGIINKFGSFGGIPVLANQGAEVVAEIKKKLEECEFHWEEAVKSAKDEGREGGLVTIMYNLGVCYHANGDKEKAKQVMEMLVERHSEFVDGELVDHVVKR
jgi:RNA polymerase-associated protein CTR9